MRDRLIELLGDYLYSEQIADHLLANGVIVPPCKVGDTVYILINGFDFVAEGKVKSITKHDVDISVIFFVHGYFEQRRTAKDFGKTVFTSREKAEQALKGGEE